MKREIKPLYDNVLVLPYAENPYANLKTESGFMLVDGEFESQDSGEKEKLDLFVGCGSVIEVGPTCKYLKVGDDIFFDTRSMRPVPFMRQGFLQGSERNVIAMMNDNLNEREKSWT